MLIINKFSRSMTSFRTFYQATPNSCLGLFIQYIQLSLSRLKIQKKAPSFPLLSPEGWSLRGVRINPGPQWSLFLFLIASHLSHM